MSSPTPPLSEDYLEVVRALPRPTEGQTDCFARYVSSAHSWYKHLPLAPRVPFFLFLDPTAGMSLTYTHSPDGTFPCRVQEITDESTRFHYTWQTTRDYRRRFGFWNYHAAGRPRPGEPAEVDPAAVPVEFLTPGGVWRPIADAVKEAGTVYLNAAVHPHPNLAIWSLRVEQFWPAAAADLQAADPVSGRAGLDLLLSSALRRPDGRDTGAGPEEAALPERLLEVIRAAVAEHRHGQVWLWPDQEWLDSLLAEGATREQFPAILRFAEREQARHLASLSPARARQGTQEVGTAANLGSALAEERLLQLAEMRQAMRRVLAVVYPSTAL
jgi:hypothetical protein